MAKPALFLWSKAAVRSAGQAISTLHSQILTEVTDVIADSGEWFLHAVAGKDEDSCYVCTGQETPDVWNVFVQTGFYKQMTVSGDSPFPERQGRVFQVPETIDEPDNKLFSAVDNLLN